MNNKNILKRIKGYFEEIRDSEKMYYTKKYGLLGTDNIDDMVGKVGFIDKNGKYYPVRDIITNDDKDDKDGVVIHEEWAKMYLRYILKRTGNYASATVLLVRNFGFVFLIEGAEDERNLQVVGRIVSNEQRNSIDKLKSQYKTLKKVK